MGSVVSAIGRALTALVSAIAGVIMAIIGGITSVLVAIWDFFISIICCRCGSRRRTRTRSARTTRTSGRRGYF